MNLWLCTLFTAPMESTFTKRVPLTTSSWSTCISALLFVHHAGGGIHHITCGLFAPRLKKETPILIFLSTVSQYIPRGLEALKAVEKKNSLSVSRVFRETECQLPQKRCSQKHRGIYFWTILGCSVTHCDGLHESHLFETEKHRSPVDGSVSVSGRS